MKVFNLIVSSLFLLVSIAWFGPSQAEAATCQTTTAMVYSNGIFNTKRDAFDSMRALKKRLVQSDPAYGNKQLYEFHLAFYSYNDSLGSALVQLLEVFVQWVNENIGDFWRWIGGIIAAPQWFNDAMVLMANTQTSLVFTADADFQKMINGDGRTDNPGYRKLLQDGKRVVVVSHSQGNFYANAAYDLLIAENSDWTKRIGVTGVATPAGRVAGGGSYLTLPEDSIINSVPGSLPPLMDSAQQYPGFAALVSPVVIQRGKEAWKAASYGHNFVAWYLMGNFSRKIIIDNIVATQARLDAPFKHDWETISGDNFKRFYPDMGWLQWPYLYKERCLRDDSSTIGFQTSVWNLNKSVEIKATSLAGAETIPDYRGVLVNAPYYIVPVPNGVGFISLLYDNIINYWLDPWLDATEFSGTTTIILTSITWDRTNATWLETSSEMVMPPFTLNFQNVFGCSGQCPLPQDFGYDPYTNVPAYGPEISVTSSSYTSNVGAFQTGPNKSIYPFIGGHEGNVTTHFIAIVTIMDGQLSSRPVIEMPIIPDDYYAKKISPLSIGLPERYVDPPRILQGYSWNSVQLLP